MESLARIRRYAKDVGRDPSEIDVAYSAAWFDDPAANMRPTGERPYFTGPPEQVAADIRAFEQMGVRHLMVGFQRPTLPETTERMERFMVEVAPLV